MNATIAYVGVGKAAQETRQVAEISWLQLAGVALGSGLTVKILDIGYQETRRHFERAQTATRFVDEHLDPLLKASDELVGKLLAAGEAGFASLWSLDGGGAGKAR